jgi:adenine-specific DNA-methyltransferase
MEKKEEIQHVEVNKIFNQDCVTFLKNLPNECCDSCITDPPYWGVVDEDWDKQWKNIEEYKSWCEEWIKEISRVTKKSGSFFIFGYSYQLSHLLPIIESYGFKFRQQIVIWKGMKSAAGRVSSKLKMFPTTTEYIYYFVKDSTSYIRDLLQEKAIEKKLSAKEINEYLGKASNGGGTWSSIAGKKQKNLQEPTKEDWEKLNTLFGNLPNYDDLVYTFNLPMGLTDVFDDINFYIPKENKIHPTEKPLKLIDRLVLACSNESDLILDPFMGSGSLAISCINNKRNYLGCELDKVYYDEIINRIEKNESPQ